MNFHNFNFDHVEPTETWTGHARRSHSRSASQTLGTRVMGTGGGYQSPRATPEAPFPARQSKTPSPPRQQQSLSPQPSSQSPSLPEFSTPPQSSSELYGPDRYYGAVDGHSSPQEVMTSERQPHVSQALDSLYGSGEPAIQASMMPLLAPGGLPNIKDEMTMAAGKVTPGVDDTPYIQHALEALTREKGVAPSMGYNFPSGTTGQSISLSAPRGRLSDEEAGWPFANTHASPVEEPLLLRSSEDDEEYVDMDERQLISRATAVPVKALPLRGTITEKTPLNGDPKDPMAGFPNPTIPLTNLARSTPVLFHTDVNDSGHWVPVTREMLRSIDPGESTYPLLTYKPRILRPFSMLILITLATLMIAALIFCTTFANDHSGLTRYTGTIYSGQYFVFRILPQILSAVILVYAQSVVSASMRILPFVSMASEDPATRYLALFRRNCPRSFLWPETRGPWQFQVFSVATWLMCFSVPLHSTAFTCIFTHNHWTWAPVTGVIWTLVGLYVVLIVSAIILTTFWFNQWTGLRWDVRSIADLIPLLSRSNTLDSYRGTESLERRDDLQSHLRNRWFDRLGYWRTQDMVTGGIWYTVGSPFSKSNEGPTIAREETRATSGFLGLGRKPSPNDSFASRGLAVPTRRTLGRSQFIYLPLPLQTVPLLSFVALATVLLLALLVVSFLPATRLEAGFRAMLRARPYSSSHFSPADFLYGFLPSLLGMLLFLLFQSLDQLLRTLQPWGELGRPDGGKARKSILADYTACLPFQVTYHAVQNTHWRLAFVSLLSTAFVFLPVLGGGLFMALTSHDAESNATVLVFPNMPVFGVLLALLFLYLFGLVSLLPNRVPFCLPQGTDMTCLADVIGMCSAEDLVTDAAFRSVGGAKDLRTRLGAHPNAIVSEESIWYLGCARDREDQRVSVRRMKRFTEKWGGVRRRTYEPFSDSMV